MRKLSIKLKITLWFTIFMIILSAVVFAFISFVSNSTASNQLKNALTTLVNNNMQEIEYEDGLLEQDDDFVSYHNGIYCLVFYGDGVKFSGYAPYAELERQPLEDFSIRSATIDGETYLIYDRLTTDKDHGDFWVRGVVLESGNAITSSAVYRAVLIALPLLILLAAVGGYLIAKHALHPIQKISQTADEIGSSGDLTKRIALESNGDEVHQLAGSFNRMFDRLQTNFQAERNFTSDASHELRTPITTILAQCEYAFENAAGEQELYEAIGAIQKQGYRMSHIIESLLYFTRMEQQTEKPDFETVNLSETVLSVCMEQIDSTDKNIVLTHDIQPGIIRKADMALIARMTENLIRNAYRYGKENGTIQVGLKESGNTVILSVADDGVGIAPEEIPRIWNRFYRVDKSRSSAKGAGLGLGLAMVKQIAELHGGIAEVESQLDRGSVFTIKL